MRGEPKITKTKSPSSHLLSVGRQVVGVVRALPIGKDTTRSVYSSTCQHRPNQADHWHLRLPLPHALHGAQLLPALHGAPHESACPGQGSGMHSEPLAEVYLHTSFELQVSEVVSMQWRPHWPY